MKDFEKNKNFCEENQDTNDALNKSFSKKESNTQIKDDDDFLSKIADSIARGIRNSFLGYVFSDLYAKLNQKWKNAGIYRFFHQKKNKFRSRTKVANLYESSLTPEVLTRFFRSIVQAYSRVVGLAVFIFGVVVLFMGILKFSFNPGIDALLDNDSALVNFKELFLADGYYLMVGIALTLLSLPLTVSKKRIGEMFLQGKVSSFIIHQMLNVEEDKLEPDNSTTGGSYVLSLELSLLLGFITFWIKPFDLFGLLLFATLCVMIFYFPEFGIIGIMLMIPFVHLIDNPSLMLMLFIVITVISFLFKFIRGKRILRFELVDMGVLIFGVLIALGGVFTQGGKSSTMSSLMYCGFLCIYFLIVNSYIRKTWIYRGIKMMVIATAVVAIVAIIDGGVVNPSQTDMNVFFDMGARLDAFFGNPNMLGAYLVIVFPFVLAQATIKNKTVVKLIYVFSTLIVIVAIVLTWSRGAWLGLIAAIAVFLLVSDFRNLWVVLLGGATLVPAIIYLAPESISRRFISIVTFSDSSVKYRLDIWEGVGKTIANNLWTGIGVGESAFAKVYPQYAEKGTEMVVHSHSMLGQILVELGVFALIVFLVTMFMFGQKCFLGIKSRERGSKSRTMISAGYASVIATFVMGFTDHVFYNYRVFLVFGVLVGLTVALTKINDKEISKMNEATRVNSNSRSADLDILIED